MPASDSEQTTAAKVNPVERIADCADFFISSYYSGTAEDARGDLAVLNDALAEHYKAAMDVLADQED